LLNGTDCHNSIGQNPGELQVYIKVRLMQEPHPISASTKTKGTAKFVSKKH